MKKIILLLLISSCTFGLYAQETPDTTLDKTKVKTDESKTKIKDDKAKMKDEDGKIKIKDNDEMTGDNETKTKVKGDKMKMKDDAGKVKVKGEGNMNTDNSNSGTMNTNTSISGATNTTTNKVTVVWADVFPPVPANLPVVGSGVSAEVVTALKSKYGTTLYDIKQIKSTSGQLIYVVRTFDTAGMKTEYVDAAGTAVSQ